MKISIWIAWCIIFKRALNLSVITWFVEVVVGTIDRNASIVVIAVQNCCVKSVYMTCEDDEFRKWRISISMIYVVVELLIDIFMLVPWFVYEILNSNSWKTQEDGWNDRLRFGVDAEMNYPADVCLEPPEKNQTKWFENQFRPRVKMATSNFKFKWKHYFWTLNGCNLKEFKILNIWKTRANKTKSPHDTHGYVEIWNLVFKLNFGIIQSQNHISDFNKFYLLFENWKHKNHATCFSSNTFSHVNSTVKIWLLIWKHAQNGFLTSPTYRIKLTRVKRNPWEFA